MKPLKKFCEYILIFRNYRHVIKIQIITLLGAYGRTDQTPESKSYSSNVAVYKTYCKIPLLDFCLPIRPKALGNFISSLLRLFDESSLVTHVGPADQTLLRMRKLSH